MCRLTTEEAALYTHVVACLCSVDEFKAQMVQDRTFRCGVVVILQLYLEIQAEA